MMGGNKWSSNHLTLTGGVVVLSSTKLHIKSMNQCTHTKLPLFDYEALHISSLHIYLLSDIRYFTDHIKSECVFVARRHVEVKGEIFTISWTPCSELLKLVIMLGRVKPSSSKAAEKTQIEAMVVCMAMCPIQQLLV